METSNAYNNFIFYSLCGILSFSFYTLLKYNRLLNIQKKNLEFFAQHLERLDRKREELDCIINLYAEQQEEFKSKNE